MQGPPGAYVSDMDHKNGSRSDFGEGGRIGSSWSRTFAEARTVKRELLAEQAGLAGRPVVVKVSGIEGNEPQTLAQLQHTHVMPIYSVHEDARAGLRAVCMPYFGGASLSAVLRSLWSGTRFPTEGKQLV